MKIVLFDIDHTLTASPKGVNALASKRMFKECFGIDASEDSVEKVGMTEWGIIERVLLKHGSDLLPADNVQHKVPDNIYERWAEILEEESEGKPATLLPGMWELVEALSNDADFKLGLLTGNSYWRSEVKLKAIGIDEFFRARSGEIVGAFGNEARTRDGLIAFAEDRLKFDNDDLIMVDDSLIGAQMLKNRSDIYAIFVATGSASVSELSISGKPVFEDLESPRWEEAYQLLKEWQPNSP